MRYNKFLVTVLLGCLTLGWTGCMEESSLEELPAEAGRYNARLVAQFQIQADNLDAEAFSNTRANDGKVTFSDMWYVVFDAATEKAIVSAKGEKLRHLSLTDNQLNSIEEQLPEGDYILSFLVMAAGGDSKAVLPVESLRDQWLTTGTDGTVNGDFFYGQEQTTIRQKLTTTLNVTMSRVSGLFKINTEMIDASQEKLLRKTEFILNNPLPYKGMSAAGVMLATTDKSPQTIDVTMKEGAFFALVPSDTRISCDGQLLVTLTEDTKSHQRLYQTEGLEVERGKRTSYTLNLNLPFDRLSSLDQSAVKSRNQMFATGEKIGTITSRQFQLNQPLKVTFNSDATSVQFFSPVGIGPTEIYARIKTTRDYFKVYELDTIRPFEDLTLESPLLSNEEGYYLTENGRIIRIPAGKNLTNGELEYKVICQSDYWKKLEKIQLNPTIGFYNGTAGSGKDSYNMNNTLTAKRARMIVSMLLNWGVMFSSPIFEQTLDEWPSPKLDTAGKAHKEFYWPDAETKLPVSVSKDEIRVRLKEYFAKGTIDFTVHTHEGSGGGAVGVVFPKTKYKIYSLWDEVYATAFTPYNGYGYVPYHELAHLMGYPDNYGSGENTMASIGFTGWTDLCAMIFQDMSSRNELPASSLEILDRLNY